MFSHCCNEPSLDELFGDFAIQLLMRRDGLTEGDIRELLCKVNRLRKKSVGGVSSPIHRPLRVRNPLI
jgi:hypothetical protein